MCYDRCMTQRYKLKEVLLGWSMSKDRAREEAEKLNLTVEAYLTAIGRADELLPTWVATIPFESDEDQIRWDQADK